MGKYQRMTLAVRCQIDSFLQVGFSIPDIAKKLNYNKSSIYREIDRNFYNSRYCPKRAQNFTSTRYSKCRRHYKIKEPESFLINNLLSKDLSPEQISGRLKLEKNLSLSHECIYQYIEKNKDLKKHLRRPKRRGISRYQGMSFSAKHGKLITKRLKIINNRQRYGDWERDLFYGANRRQVLICVERKSRFIKLSKLENTKSQTVKEKTESLVLNLPRKVKSMTNDNGTEFRGAALCIPTYFCRPLKPHERGTVENTIGLLRQYVTRKTDLDTIREEDILTFENKINLRPRKVLNYKTPYEVFYKTKVALAN